MTSRGVPAARATRGHPTVRRASASDRAFLAMDTGDVPQQFGVVLELDRVLPLTELREVIATRVSAVPRLRQRLVGVPWGCGGPIWVDDPVFDLRHHVREVACSASGDEQDLMDTALQVVMTPLGRDAPLWSMILVGGLQEDRSALVIVLHHALADGIGGLNVLAALVDPGSEDAEPAFPAPGPDVRRLLGDALGNKVRAVVGVVGSWHLLRTSMGAGGGLRPPRIADCSLIQRSGHDRRVIVVRSRYDEVRACAHRFGATTNDAVLVAVAGALRQVLEGRGERVDPLVVTVPVSGRRGDQAPELGNLVSPLLVPVPTTGDVGDRLTSVSATVRSSKAGATGPPPIAVLGWLFRSLARLGCFRWYMNHQHRFHTLVSHLRGPAEPLSFAGRRIVAAQPIGVSDNGNTTVYFEVLSYDGTLTISAIVDPAHFPDADRLRLALQDELDAMCSVGDPRSPGTAEHFRQ